MTTPYQDAVNDTLAVDVSPAMWAICESEGIDPFAFQHYVNVRFFAAPSEVLGLSAFAAEFMLDLVRAHLRGDRAKVDGMLNVLSLAAGYDPQPTMGADLLTKCLSTLEAISEMEPSAASGLAQGFFETVRKYG